MSTGSECPGCGEEGEESGKHRRGIRCNNSSCRVEVYNDHSYAEMGSKDKVVNRKTYTGYKKTKQTQNGKNIWLVEDMDKPPQRGNGNSLTHAIKRIDEGDKAKIEITELKPPEYQTSDYDPFSEEY